MQETEDVPAKSNEDSISLEVKKDIRAAAIQGSALTLGIACAIAVLRPSEVPVRAYVDGGIFCACMAIGLWMGKLGRNSLLDLKDKNREFKKGQKAAESMILLITYGAQVALGGVALTTCASLLEDMKPSFDIPQDASVAQIPYYLKFRTANRTLKAINSFVWRQMEDCRLKRVQCSDAQVSQLRRRLSGFEDIGINPIEAQLFNHMKNPYEYPDVPREFQKIFPEPKKPDSSFGKNEYRGSNQQMPFDFFR